MNALVFFAPLLLRQRVRLLRAIVLSLITLAAGIALLGTSGWFLTAAALTAAGAMFNLFSPSSLVRGFSFIRILARYGEKLAGHDATLRLLSDIRGWLFGVLFPILPLRDRRLGRADLVSRLVADVEALDTTFLVFFGPILTALLAGVAMVLGLAALLPGAAPGFAACFFGATLVVPLVLVAASRRAGAAANAASADLRAAVLDGIDCHQDLVAFGATGPALAGAGTAARRLAASRRHLGTASAIASGAVQAFAGGAVIAILLAGLPALEAGAIDGPVLAGILLAGLAGFEAAAPLVRGAGRLAGAAVSAGRLKALAQSVPRITDPVRPVDPPPGGTIAFEGVAFGYDPARPFLSGLDLVCRSGERIAFVGPSGAGKSTIAHLLARLEDPTAGRITLAGVDLRDIALQTLRRRIALMTQDAPVFLDTVRGNLLIGNPAASDEMLWRALADVGLAGFVAALADGLGTVVAEAGQTLSAGQARRLCLARTLLSGADVLVLDEPTSGLDSEAEQAFLGDLPRIAAGRTLVVITHAALPRGFDRVLRIAAGTIAA